MKNIIAASTLALGFALAPAAQAATVSLQDYRSENGAPVIIDLGDGLTVTIEGGTIDDDGTNAVLVEGSLTNVNRGRALGVSALPDDRPVIETQGDDLNEFIQLTFNQAVTLSAFSLFLADDLDDVVLLADGSFVFRQALTGAGSDSIVDIAADVVGTSFIIAAGLLEPGSSARPGTRNDEFALAGFEAAPVPVPAAAVLFGTALAAGAAARKRRA
jgi:hypothetical protein